ncbi:transforming growth factor beta superfamily signaling ligand [Ciona intestinalis]
MAYLRFLINSLAMCVFCLIGTIKCQSLSRREELLLNRCLDKSYITRENRTLSSPLKSRQCTRYLQELSAIESTAGDQRDQNKADPQANLFSYVSAITNWRNKEGSLDSLLLNRAGSCHHHSKRMYHYWTDFFLARQTTSIVALAAQNRTWGAMNGKLLLRHSTARHLPANLVAAELVVIRKRPSVTREKFGKYKTLVTMREAGGRSRTLHAGYQSSCPHRESKFLMLNLDTRYISNWLAKRNSTNLLIFSQIIPRTRYGGTAETLLPVDVVQHIAGLVLHFQRPINSETYRLRSSARLRQAVHASFPLTFTDRNRRNAAIRPRIRTRHQHVHGSELRLPRRRKLSCSLEPFVVPKTVTQHLNVTWPENGKRFWDISRCEGLCRHPIPAHISQTNHAIAINSHTTKGACCVPIRLRGMDYIHLRNGELRTKSLEELVALECGCR